jgi:hypothetical protein
MVLSEIKNGLSLEQKLEIQRNRLEMYAWRKLSNTYNENSTTEKVDQEIVHLFQNIQKLSKEQLQTDLKKINDLTIKLLNSVRNEVMA